VKTLRTFGYACLILCVPYLAGAEDSVGWAKRTVEDGLVSKLARKSRGFSRERPVPHERRVRLLGSAVSADKAGRGFVGFAVDVRYGPNWHEGDIVGCVYRDSGKIFVKLGDAYHPHSVLLGKDAAPVPGVCEAAPPEVSAKNGSERAKSRS